MQLTIRTKQTGPGVITLTPRGPIDANTHPLLDQAVGRVLPEPIKMLVLDMEGVDFVSSAGIGSLVKAKKSIKSKGGDLALTNLQPQIKKAIEIMQLLPTLGVFESRAELDEYLGKIQRQVTGQEEEP